MATAKQDNNDIFYVVDLTHIPLDERPADRLANCMLIDGKTDDAFLGYVENPAWFAIKMEVFNTHFVHSFHHREAARAVCKRLNHEFHNGKLAVRDFLRHTREDVNECRMSHITFQDVIQSGVMSIINGEMPL